jgi:VIT1/CCC1 family predicted Fe2+/Mn2+ transporter
MTPSESKVITTASGKRIRVPTVNASRTTVGTGSSSPHPDVQTIEKTSKPLKAQGCLSGIVIAIGTVIMIAAFSGNTPSNSAAALGGILLFIGFIWAIVTRIRVWWHHE